MKLFLVCGLFPGIQLCGVNWNILDQAQETAAA